MMSIKYNTDSKNIILCTRCQAKYNIKNNIKSEMNGLIKVC